MNPALAASGSGGLAGAVVVLLNAALQHWGVALGPEVVAAEVTVMTAFAGVGAHYLTRIAPDIAPLVQAPEAPK